MTATVRIPTPLRSATGGAATVETPPGTLREVLDELRRAHPGIGERLLDDEGKLRRFVDDEDVRFQDGLDTAVPEGATVSIIPAVAGGATA